MEEAFRTTLVVKKKLSFAIGSVQKVSEKRGKTKKNEGSTAKTSYFIRKIKEFKPQKIEKLSRKSQEKKGGKLAKKGCKTIKTQGFTAKTSYFIMKSGGNDV